jgi:hypothetical protein
LNENPAKSICWVSPFRSWRARCLIFVGWVEVRNPTLPNGLYPTYQNRDFPFRYYLKIVASLNIVIWDLFVI